MHSGPAGSQELGAVRKENMGSIRICDAAELFKISVAALHALTTSGNWAIATVVGRRGASLIVAEG